MSNFKVRNKKTHYTNSNAQSYKISLRDKHIFSEKMILTVQCSPLWK